jgi:GMP reductase
MEYKLDYSDVLMLPKVPSSPIGTRADIDLTVKHRTYEGLPLIVANMPSIGTYKIAGLLTPEKIVTFIYKDHPESYHLEHLKEIPDRRYIGLTCGVRESDVQRVLNVTSKIDVGFINLDTANAYGNFEALLRNADRIKKQRPNSLLVVGNICTPEVVGRIAETGADYIKVGVGPGSACLTRSEVGVGVPQLSAVLETVDAARGLDAAIIADGGCAATGDICKALGAGARMVMLGGMFANSYECDNIVEVDGRRHVEFWGLGSRRQFNQTFPSESEHRPNEGRNMLIPCTTSILETINQIKGALRSVCTYVGSPDIASLPHHTSFIRVSNQTNTFLAKYEVNSQ